MVQIIPAILATTEEDYKSKLSKIEGSVPLKGGWVQIDLMDNKFVQNKSVNADVVKKFPTKLKIEAHLMVENPYIWVSSLLDFPIKRFIMPIELSKEILDSSIGLIRALSNVDIGFSLNPETPVDKLKEYLEVADSILIMSVHPGFGGQNFIPETVAKVKDVAGLRKDNSLEFLIGVDGGVNKEVAKDLARNGADYLVLGSHLLKGDIDENIEQIWEAI